MGSATFSQELASGRTPSVATTGENAIAFGRALAPANLSARQASSLGLTTSGTYGPLGSTSLRSDALQKSLASKLQARSRGSILYATTWKVRVTPSGRPICALRASPWRAIHDCPDPLVAAELLDFAAFASGNLGAHDGDHIRQRLCFYAVDGLADAHDQGKSGRGIQEPRESDCSSARPSFERPAGLRAFGGVGEPDDTRLARPCGAERGQFGPVGQITPCGPVGGMAARGGATDAVDGERNNADWLLCRDGKWRPVGPGAFPLDNAPPSRMGRLRAYGNALDAETVVAFLSAVRECAP